MHGCEKNGFGGPSGGLRRPFGGPCEGPAGTPAAGRTSPTGRGAGAPPRPPAGGALSVPRDGHLFYALHRISRSAYIALRYEVYTGTHIAGFDLEYGMCVKLVLEVRSLL